MNEFLLSIVVISYNEREFLRDLLDGLDGQTIGVNDVEIIIVDDGSTDGSQNDVELWVDKNSNTRRFINKSNGGQSSARNYGLREAKGKFIWFIDGDDLIHQDAVSVVKKNLSETDSDGVLVQFTRIFKNIDNQISLKVRRNESPMRLLASGVVKDYAWQYIVKKELVEEYVYFPNERLFEDVATTYRLYANLSNVDFIENPIIYYRSRSGSTMTSKSKRMVTSMYENLNEINEFIRYGNWTKKQRNQLEMQRLNMASITLQLNAENSLLEKEDVTRVKKYISIRYIVS